MLVFQKDVIYISQSLKDTSISNKHIFVCRDAAAETADMTDETAGRETQGRFCGSPHSTCAARSRPRIVFS